MGLSKILIFLMGWASFHILPRLWSTVYTNLPHRTHQENPSVLVQGCANLSVLADLAGYIFLAGLGPARTIFRKYGKCDHQVWQVLLRLTVRSNVKPKCGNNSSKNLHVFLLFWVSAKFRYSLRTCWRSELYTALSKFCYRLRADDGPVNALVID